MPEGPSAKNVDFHLVDKERWDAVVVGAGPAGALAAQQLALDGTRVLLVDQKAFPRWKVCGACVNERALSVLRQVRLHDIMNPLRAVPINRFQLCVNRQHALIDVPGGVAVSRSAFDAALVQRAVEAGVRFLPETHASLMQNKGPTRCVQLNQSGNNRIVATQVVLAAGGLGSRFLAQEPKFHTTTTSTSRIGVSMTAPHGSDHFEPGTIYMAVGRDGYVGLVRVEDGRLNIAAALSKRFARQCGSVDAAVRSVLQSAGLPDSIGPPNETSLMPGSTRQPGWQGTVTLTRRTQPIALDRVFLLGDAAAYVEPFTGEGIAWALSSAVAIAPIAKLAMQEETWRPELAASWSRAYHEIVGRRQWLCRAVALTLRHPFAVRGILRLLSWNPSLANPLIQRLNTPISKACDL